MLLLNPPLTKPAEPPAGIAQLAGALTAHGHNYDIFDLNLHGILYLLENTKGGNDTWTKRAMKNRADNLIGVRHKELYAHHAKYQKTILELNRLIECNSRDGITLGLANYQDKQLSPLRSEDLLHVAEQPEKSLFYPFYTSCISQLLTEKSPLYVGISINYLSQAINGFALIGYLKKLAPDVKIIIGGGLITSWMRNPNWHNPFRGLIDHCVDGCGEKPLLEILGTPQNKPILPDYDALSNLPYFSPGFILPFNTSTGCYWNKCSFCPERAEGNIFSMRKKVQVTTEINQLVQSYSPVLLHLLDNAIPPAVLGQLIKNNPGVPWYGFVRIIDDFLEPDYCIALKKAGCTMLKLG
ncbi:MAG: radical SAM protein, partial [Desulfocapsaceae bacterium]|nr:radical SAM protein [Desulfocapsaceae bacterium]